MIKRGNKINNFIIIDTEGFPDIYEIAIIDKKGEVIYNKNFSLYKESKEEVLDILLKNKDKKIIAHNAEHEKEVIKNLFKKFNIEEDFEKLTFECTYELSKILFPNQKSYSLLYLAKKLNLKINNKPVNADFTHKAKYDALLTYKLYKKILGKMMIEELKNRPNPFSSNRVDNPFQTLPDDKNIHKNEYQRLKNIINDIKHDPNRQSRGAVILANPGEGKSHLVMRLAKDLLKNNRLLFIRQPNNPKNVKYHIYQRILESLFEKIPNTNYSQLEYLLAKTLSKILIDRLKDRGKNEKIKEILTQNPLNLFEKLGKEGTKTRRDNWKLIEKITMEYWESRFGISDFSSIFVRGLIRYSYYKDINKKEIIKRWLSAVEMDEERLQEVGLKSIENIDKEEFALEAIITLGKLSLHDEPLILAFDQLEGLKYNEELAISFLESLKEIFTHLKNSLIICNFFPERWEWLTQKFDASFIDRLGQTKIYLNRPSDKELLEILHLRLKEAKIDEDFFQEDEISNILKADSIREFINNAYEVYERKVFGIKSPAKKDFENFNIKKEILEIKRDLKALMKAFNIKPLKTTLNNKQIENYFNQIRDEFSNRYKKAIFTAEDDLGKFRKIADFYLSFKHKKPLIDFLQYGRKKLPANIILNKMTFIFLYENGKSLSARSKNLIELMNLEKGINIFLIRDSRCNDNATKYSKAVLGKIQTQNSVKYLEIGKEKRVSFDSVDKIIDDINNKDVSFTKEEFFEFLKTNSKDLWFIDLIEQI